MTSLLANRRWLAKDTKLVRRYYATMPTKQLALMVQRSVIGVCRKAYELHLIKEPPKTVKYRTPESIAKAIATNLRRKAARDAAALIKREGWPRPYTTIAIALKGRSYGGTHRSTPTPHIVRAPWTPQISLTGNAAAMCVE